MLIQCPDKVLCPTKTPAYNWPVLMLDIPEQFHLPSKITLLTILSPNINYLFCKYCLCPLWNLGCQIPTVWSIDCTIELKDNFNKRIWVTKWTQVLTDSLVIVTTHLIALACSNMSQILWTTLVSLFEYSLLNKTLTSYAYCLSSHLLEIIIWILFFFWCIRGCHVCSLNRVPWLTIGSIVSQKPICCIKTSKIFPRYLIFLHFPNLYWLPYSKFSVLKKYLI